MVSGTWKFYKDANFKEGRKDHGGFSFECKPNFYPSLDYKGISSNKCINF